MKGKSFIDVVVFFLVVVGGINWGLVGAFNFDLVATLFGAVPMVVTVLYILVGVAALYMLFKSFTVKVG